MSKVYVGSTNPAKVAAVKSVFNEYEVIAIKTNSGVSNQPIGDPETIEGAKNRSLSLPTNGLRIGLEGGIMLQDETLFLINWGVLIDSDDNIYYAGGTRIPLPNDFKILLTNCNLELADLIDEYAHKTNVRSNEGAIGILTNNLVIRTDIFTHICKLLYGQYLHHKGGK